MDLAHLKNKKVLYVEDDEAIVKSFTKILNKVFGEVLVAKNGEEGLELYNGNKEFISFVIADIKMPKMDGLEMCEIIKKDNPDIPFIITTAHAEHEYLVKAENIGVYKYITKPLNISNLVTAISEFKLEEKNS